MWTTIAIIFSLLALGFGLITYFNRMDDQETQIFGPGGFDTPSGQSGGGLAKLSEQIEGT